MKQTYLGIDIGTSGCKLALFDDQGALVSHTSETYPCYYPTRGWAEQDADDWWTVVCRRLLQLWEKGADPASVAAVGIDGQGWSAIPVDADGTVLARTPIWMDTRAAEVCEKYRGRLTDEYLFSVSGNPFSPTYTLPKVLYWMEEEPALIQKAQYILQSNAFIAYRLTGAVSMDLSMAYGWHNYDIKKLRYDTALTREFGIPERFLVEPVASHAIVGHVTPEAARLTGLVAGTPVVAGGLDAACSTLGVGVINPGQTQEQGGQAGGMSICLDEPLSHERLILGAHVIPGRWLLQGGTVGGGASLKWFSEQLGAAHTDGSALFREGHAVFELLSEEAQTSPVGSHGLVFLPYLMGERSPIWDPEALGMYFGVKFSNTHADFARATMEGVAFALRHNLETASSVGASITELRSTGGSANSHVWTQIKADVTNTTMVVPASDHATTRGAAMLAMLGAGCYADPASVVDALVRIERQQEPVAHNHETYDAYYDVYTQLYPRTADCMKQLYALSG